MSSILQWFHEILINLNRISSCTGKETLKAEWKIRTSINSKFKYFISFLLLSTLFIVVYSVRFFLFIFIWKCCLQVENLKLMTGGVWKYLMQQIEVIKAFLVWGNYLRIGDDLIKMLDWKVWFINCSKLNLKDKIFQQDLIDITVKKTIVLLKRKM